jgi:hypothetical protein
LVVAAKIKKKQVARSLFTYFFIPTPHFFGHLQAARALADSNTKRGTSPVKLIPRIPVI